MFDIKTNCNYSLNIRLTISKPTDVKKLTGVWIPSMLKRNASVEKLTSDALGVTAS